MRRDFGGIDMDRWEGESLDAVWEELTYTEARLLEEEVAKDLAIQLPGLRERLIEVQRRQRDARQRERIAQFAVDATETLLGKVVRAVEKELLRLCGGNRQHPRFLRYMAQISGLPLRLGLESEIERLRSWTELLAKEPESSLKEHGARLVDALIEAIEVLEERQRAAFQAADRRVREVVRIIDDFNAARRSLFLLLAERAIEHRLPADWPEQFFRARVRVRAASASASVC
jgi:hypothetical protein